MLKVVAYTDLESARRLWQRHWPRQCLFDLWPVRSCFQEQYNHRPYFLIAVQGDHVRGMLALSWIDGVQSYGHFPGELWQGKTWLEQNKIPADSGEVIRAMIDHVPAEGLIRYISLEKDNMHLPWAQVDEIRYFFLPALHGYCFETYMRSFSSKTRKKMRCEADRLEARGLTYRYNCLADIELMFRLNTERYHDQSYFSDVRFLRSIEVLAAWLHANGLLRVTTVLIGGKVAAVDLGAVFNSTYTVFAGGVHADFTGVAKLINFHHIKWACGRRLAEVDFLCGDFNWKNRFHLTSRPLYKIAFSLPAACNEHQSAYSRSRACGG